MRICVCAYVRMCARAPCLGRSFIHAWMEPKASMDESLSKRGQDTVQGWTVEKRRMMNSKRPCWAQKKTPRVSRRQALSMKTIFHLKN